MYQCFIVRVSENRQNKEGRRVEYFGSNIVGLNCLSTLPKEVKANVEKARSETVAKLWRVTEQMNILYPENWTRIAAEEILWFQGYILMS